MTDVIVSFIMGILSVVEIYVMAVGVFCLQVHRNKGRQMLSIGLILLSGLMEIACYYYYVDEIIFMGIIITPLALLAGLEGRKIRIIAVYLCSLTYIALPYFCIDIICANWRGYSYVENENNTYSIVRSLLSILVVIGLAVFFRRDKKYAEYMRKFPVRFLAIEAVCAICGGLLQETYVMATTLFEGERRRAVVSVAFVIVIVTFYALGIIIAYIIGLKERYMEENRQKDEYLRMSKEYIRLVRQNSKETRKIRHDMNSHMNVMNEYLSRGHYTKAKEYVEVFQKHMNQKISKVSAVGNETVDAVITSYMNQEDVEHISWEVCGKFPSSMDITDFDLCTIFSNLLSNSVEACKKVEKEKRFIHVDIKRTDEMLVIEVENSVAEIVPIETLGKITTKADKKNHGLGIKNILEVVEKIKGQILFENDEQAFRTRIVLDLQ